MPLGIVNDSEFENERLNSDVEVRNRTNGIHTNIRPDTNNDLTLDIGDDPNQPRTSINPTATVIEMPRVGRIPEVGNVPQSLRKILGETVAIEGLQAGKELANALGGLSQPTLSTYGSGHVSRSIDSSASNDLTDYINGRKNKITKKALHKLNLALTHIEEEKLVELGPIELSGVAKNMAQIVKSMEPEKKEDGKIEPVQFHIYAPSIRAESHYEVVTAKDNY